jgi:glycosyltransferase involved in cell wall biosynthesis
LEALEAGRPVVSTTIGLEGLETLEGKGVVVADQEDGFADAVNRLLDAPHTAIALGKVGRTAVHAGHLWSSTLRPMFDAIDARITTSTWPTNAIASGTSRSNRLGIEPGT